MNWHPEKKFQSLFQAVMESVAPSSVVEDNNLFVIATVGETQPQEQTDHVPVKKLKRRNAAMYASTDWLILIII